MAAPSKLTLTFVCLWKWPLPTLGLRDHLYKHLSGRCKARTMWSVLLFINFYREAVLFTSLKRLQWRRDLFTGEVREEKYTTDGELVIASQCEMSYHVVEAFADLFFMQKDLFWWTIEIMVQWHGNNRLASSLLYVFGHHLMASVALAGEPALSSQSLELRLTWPIQKRATLRSRRSHIYPSSQSKRPYEGHHYYNVGHDKISLTPLV